MSFEDNMIWMEQEHVFPADIADFHNKRFDWILKNSGLAHELNKIPAITGVGSCGKASTLSFTGSIFSALGLKCAIGTKPPLNESPLGNLERWQIWENLERRRCTPDEFCGLFPLMKESVDRLEKERQDLGKAAPYDMRAYLLSAFAVAQNADLIIYEANIGRANDPVGCLPNKIMELITPIGTDHGGLLQAPPGFHDELGAMAGPFYHKASGLKLGKGAVFGRQHDLIVPLLDPASVIFGRDYDIANSSCSMDGTSFSIKFSDNLAQYLNLTDDALNLSFKLSALGLFQCENAAQALIASLVLRRRAVLNEPADSLKHFSSSRLVSLLRNISDEEFMEKASAGLSQAQVPGRLQLIAPNCVAAVASSPEKLGALLESLGKLLNPGQKVLICATFLDRIHYLKEAVQLASSWPLTESIIITRYLDNDINRDANPETLLPYSPHAVINNNIDDAFQRTKQAAQSQGNIALFLGNGMVSWLSSNK
ncbi:MAG: hypothetical protein K6G50_01930 [bacterium]|nr:hypothetical protein [bacterium]